MGRQNTSHAVMAQRFESKGSLDDFPTPPWATRALLNFVVGADINPSQSCLEPACGMGHMAKVLDEYFADVSASDIHDYGYGSVGDFLERDETNLFDWVITNPPFSLAENFISKALEISRVGVAVLARTTFIESIGRYERLFQPNQPSKFAQFSERVPMVKGRLDPKASTATGYAWLVWQKNYSSICQTVWIPPCRKSLEHPEDYQAPKSLKVNNPDIRGTKNHDKQAEFALS